MKVLVIHLGVSAKPMIPIFLANCQLLMVQVAINLKNLSLKCHKTFVVLNNYLYTFL